MEGGRYNNWLEVARLSEGAQRELLAAGDPVERVWSIWALGLRLGRGAVDHLQTDFDLESLPGVRCQLIVVLAGLGEREMVQTAALHDPDPVVRATACQYLIRTLPAGSRDIVAFAIERMRSDAPRVRHAMFAEVQAGRLRLPDEVFVEFLAATDLETRQMSLESVVALPGCSEAILRAVMDRVLAEEDEHLRRSCVEVLLQRGRAAGLVSALRDASPSLVCEVLAGFQRGGIRLSWSALVDLARRMDPEVSLALLDCLAKPLEAAAIGWVSSLTAASIAISAIGKAARSPLHEVRRKGLAMLYEILAPDTIGLLDLSVAEALLGWLRSDTDQDDGGNDEEQVTSEEDRAKRQLLVRHMTMRAR
jgi:hypothetical protein